MEISKSRVIVHALHKSGSTFLFKYFQTIAKMLKLPFYSENLGHSYPESLKNEIKGIFSPSRLFPKELSEGEMHFYQLRHPLDILVSEYYSFGYMHTIKNDVKKERRRDIIQNQTIDEYCLDVADNLYSRYASIFEVIQNADKSRYRLISYSNMVLNFSKWNENILSHFDIDDSEKLIIYKQYFKEFEQFEELSEEEIIKAKKSRHKRKMVPGDYLEKLEKPTIQRLEKKFKGIIQIIEEMKVKSNSENDNIPINTLFKEIIYSWNGKSWDSIRSPNISSLSNTTHGVYGIEVENDGNNTVWKLENNRWSYHSQASIKNIVVSKSGAVYGILRDAKKQIDVAAIWSDGKWKNINAFEVQQIVIRGEDVLVLRHDKKVFQLVEKKWLKLPGRDFEHIYVTDDDTLVGKHSIRGISFISILEEEKWKMIKGSKDFVNIFPQSTSNIYATRTNPNKDQGLLIYHWNGKIWSRLPSNRVKKFGLHNKTPLILRDTPNHKGLVFKYDDKAWSRLPNRDFKNISVGKSKVVLANK